MERTRRQSGPFLVVGSGSPAIVSGEVVARGERSDARQRPHEIGLPVHWIAGVRAAAQRWHSWIREGIGPAVKRLLRRGILGKEVALAKTAPAHGNGLHPAGPTTVVGSARRVAS